MSETTSLLFNLVAHHRRRYLLGRKEGGVVLAISSGGRILELLHADNNAQLFWEALTSPVSLSLRKLRLNMPASVYCVAKRDM